MSASEDFIIGESDVCKIEKGDITKGTGLVLFVEPRALLRQCFSECFRQLARSENIVTIPNIAEWTRMADSYPLPSAIFIYLHSASAMKDEIEEARSTFSQYPAIPPVIIVADDDEPATVRKALDWGAKGYVPSDISLEVAIEAMRLVLAGGTYVPASALIASLDKVKNTEDAPGHSPYAMFTDRQYAVIEKLREGKANKIIAYELNMRESTVKVHIRNIMRKLRATNRTQVAYLYQSMLDKGAVWDGNPVDRSS